MFREFIAYAYNITHKGNPLDKQNILALNAIK